MILTVLGPLRADRLSLAHRWPQIGPQKNHAQLPKHYTQNTYTTTPQTIIFFRWVITKRNDFIISRIQAKPFLIVIVQIVNLVRSN